MTKRALISVSDKSNIVEFAKGLEKFGFEIISTGGTYTHLKNNGVNCISIEDVTNFPEILEGRVKTLHPKIHGGLLSKRGNELHSKHVKENNIVNQEDVNILIDDYSKNILEWERNRNFIGIKMINNINDTNKKWSNQNKPFMFYNSDVKIKLGLLNNIASSVYSF